VRPCALRQKLTFPADKADLQDFKNVPLVCWRWADAAARELYTSWQFKSVGEVDHIVDVMKRRPGLASILIAVTVVLPLRADDWLAERSRAARGLAWTVNACEALHTVQIGCLPDPGTMPARDDTDERILAAVCSRPRPSMRQLFVQVSDLVDFSMTADALIDTLAATPNLVAFNLTGAEITGDPRAAEIAMPRLRSMCVARQAPHS